MKDVRLKTMTNEHLWITGLLFFCIQFISIDRIVYIKGEYCQV